MDVITALRVYRCIYVVPYSFRNDRYDIYGSYEWQEIEGLTPILADLDADEIFIFKEMLQHLSQCEYIKWLESELSLINIKPPPNLKFLAVLDIYNIPKSFLQTLTQIELMEVNYAFILKLPRNIDIIFIGFDEDYFRGNAEEEAMAIDKMTEKNINLTII